MSDLTPGEGPSPENHGFEVLPDVDELERFTPTFTNDRFSADITVEPGDFIEPYGAYVPPRRVGTDRPLPYQIGDPVSITDLDTLVRDKLYEFDWRLRPEYAGKPKQEWRVQLGPDQEITVYNYLDRTVQKPYVGYIAKALAHYEHHYPQTVQKLKTITFTDRFPDSYYGNPQQFPVQGEISDRGVMELSPKVLNHHERYRSGRMDLPNITGVVTHLMTYMQMPKLLDAWLHAGYRMIEKASGDPAHPFVVHVPSNPEECVTDLARLSLWSDIAESVVAYLYAEKLGRTFQLSNKKRQILRIFDQSTRVSRPLIQTNIRTIKQPDAGEPSRQASIYISQDLPVIS